MLKQWLQKHDIVHATWMDEYIKHLAIYQFAQAREVLERQSNPPKVFHTHLQTCQETHQLLCEQYDGQLPQWCLRLFSKGISITKESLQEHLHFNRTWRHKFAMMRADIPQEKRVYLPDIPTFLLPEDIPPLVQEFRAQQSQDYWTRLRSLVQKIWSKRQVLESFNGLAPMISIPKGVFQMGASKSDTFALSEERPQHKVQLTYDLWVSTIPCPQKLYQSICHNNPSHFKGEKHPVENVSWCDAVRFCNLLSMADFLEPVYTLPDIFDNTLEYSQQVQQNLDANGYRLLTEAEWEYVAKAGTSKVYAGTLLETSAWYDKNSQEQTQPVAQKSPNPWGLYDINGNVWEWVWDRRFRRYRPTSEENPICNRSRKRGRVRRGGSWNSQAQHIRTTARNWGNPSDRDKTIGFRIARRKTES